MKNAINKSEANQFDKLATYFSNLIKVLKRGELLSWDDYFMGMAALAATKGKCLDRKLGAVIVDPIGHTVISTGYNGAPRGIKNCRDLGYCRKEVARKKGYKGRLYEICLAVHAEQNALNEASRSGKNTKGAVMYTLARPCFICTKNIIQLGVDKIFYIEPHFSKEADQLIKESGIQLIHLKNSIFSKGFNDFSKGRLD